MQSCSLGKIFSLWIPCGSSMTHCGTLSNNPSVRNYSSFDFFNPKFDHSSYSKIYAKYHLFCCELLYQYTFFKSDLNLTMFA